MNGKFFALFCTTLVIAFSALMVQANEKKFALQRTTIGQPADQPLTWNVVNEPSAKRFILIIKNLRNGDKGMKYCSPTLDDLVKEVNISKFFPSAREGIYTVKLQAFADDDKCTNKTHETDEIIQILGPSTTETEPKFTKCETTENRKEPYDVIVVDGTSAGIGAAITAASEGLSTCLLESTSLLGGMFTSGIGNTDISFYGGAVKHEKRPYLSYGLMEELRKDYIEKLLLNKGQTFTQILTQIKKEIQEEEKKEKLTPEKEKEKIIEKCLQKLPQNQNVCTSFKIFGVVGLKYLPSEIREALYDLVEDAVDVASCYKTKYPNAVSLDVQLNSQFKTIEKKNGNYIVSFVVRDESGKTKDMTYTTKYVVDATDSGDVAAALGDYEKNKDEYCDTLNNTKSNTKSFIKEKDGKYVFNDYPSSETEKPTYCLREPTQAYSYVMTIEKYKDRNDNWSYMQVPPPSCYKAKCDDKCDDCACQIKEPYCKGEGCFRSGIEGRYTNDFFDKGLDTDNIEDDNNWTFSSGALDKNIFQVKHHDTQEKYDPKPFSEDQDKMSSSVNYYRLGDELIDSDAHDQFSETETSYANKKNDQERLPVIERYINHTMCFLYHMQHNPGNETDGTTIPKKYNYIDFPFKGEQVGLAKEDPLRGNFPARLYVREGRRINGKETFLGKDVLKRYFSDSNGKIERIKDKFIVTNELIENNGRPKQGDDLDKLRQGIGVTTYGMDSHAVALDEPQSGERKPWMMNHMTGPGVIPLGVMIPDNKEMSNILVPLAASASTWGHSVLRMEPTRLNMGQAAALAIKFANNEKGISPRDLLKPENAGLLFKLQKELIWKYGGKVFLYLDPEFHDQTDEGKKQHMAAQFLGILGIDSGSEFKNSPYTFKPGNNLFYGELSAMVKNALESLKRHTELKLQKISEKLSPKKKDKLEEILKNGLPFSGKLCFFLNLQNKFLQFLCQDQDKAHCDQISSGAIKELCSKNVMTMTKADKTFTDYIAPGYSDGSSVAENEEVTKGHFAWMIANAFGLPKAEVKEVCSDKNAYCSYLKKLVGNKIFSQTDLSAKITRGEAALAICNAYVFATGWDAKNLCKYE